VPKTLEFAGPVMRAAARCQWQLSTNNRLGDRSNAALQPRES
jgi:hypothetical protein